MPISLFTSMCPPLASMNSLLMARLSPVPLLALPGDLEVPVKDLCPVAAVNAFPIVLYRKLDPIFMFHDLNMYMPFLL